MQRTHNRILSLLLVVVMVLSMLPVIASATEQSPAAEYVALNAATGEQYTDVSDALKSAAEGQTVKLTMDATDSGITVRPNTTLDLNGYKLECKNFSCFGATVDSSAANTGLLVPSRVAFSGTNEQIAIHNGTGYQFFQVLGFNTKEVEGGKFVFQPLFEEGAHELLKAGNAVSGTKIEIHVGYQVGKFTKTAIFYYSDAMVQSYLDSYANGKYEKMFTLSVNNAAEFGELTFTPAVASKAGITINPAKISVDANGQLTEDVTLQNGQNSAVVGAGSLLEGGNLTLTTSELTESQANVELSAEETLTSLDVHVEGLSKDNTVPVLVTLTEIAPESLNKGNIHLYHVENGKTVEMTRVYSLAELDAHNEFYYDIVTGTVTVALCSFSEVAIVSDNENVWNGGFEDFDAVDGVYYIYNADQLAQMSKLVSTTENYAKASYKLVADVNFGGESNVDQGHVFYPIGYWKEQEGKNKAGETYYDHGYNFTGIFDGNGNTISGIYQNTWAMDGDYDNGYWDAAMGLFGATYDATIKNLTIDNFQSDGEFTVTGCVVAYAGGNTKFENITLTNCNPRVYNTGNGGIVGMNYNSTTEGKKDTLSFKNITIDQTNKISALWGSWDVGCGGIMGRLRDDEKHPKEINTATFENCHVSAVIDVYNDVCANYQYYQYRYSGMLIGTLDYVDTQGVDNLAGIISATDCTVTYGDWNEYWYCELVANSLASYTHDHQFSRLEKITAESDIKDSEGNWLRAGNFVIPNDDNTAATCYHIYKDADGNLYKHEHSDEGTEVVNGQTFNVEDRTCYFIPFNQLFTGYGWGSTVLSSGFNGIKLGDGTVKSQKKFTANTVESIISGKPATLGELFTAAVDETKISKSTLQVFVSPADESSTISSSFKVDTGNWANSQLTITGNGRAKITITDYFYCINTTLYVNVTANTVTLHYADGFKRVTFGESTTLPAIADFEDKAFVGWTTEIMTERNPSCPEVYNAEDEYDVMGNSHLYAVYTYTEEVAGSGESWNLVTDASDLADGDEVVIVANTENYALSTTQNGNNRGQAAITKNSTDQTVAWTGSNVQILTIKNGKTTGTLAFYTGSGYLCAASSSKNYLKTENTLSANSSWSISITSAGVATVKASGSNTRNWMRYNSSSSLFACYSSGQQDISIYKKSTGATETVKYYDTIVKACENDDHQNTSAIVVPATCTEAGYRAEFCADCGHTFDPVEIPATGHSYVNGTCSACGKTESTSATIDFTTTEQRVSWDSSSQVWSNGDLTVTNNKSGATNNVADYSNPARFYQGSELVIQFQNMTKIEIVSEENSGDKTYLSDLISAITTAGYEATTNNATVIITLADPTDTITLTLSAGQVRAYSITVYAAGGNSNVCDHEGYETSTTIIAPTCTEAGATVVTCNNCGVQISSTPIDATGHNFVDDQEFCTNNCGEPNTNYNAGGGVTETPATLSFENKAQRTSFSADQQVWEQNGITFTNDKANSSNAVADYADPVRLYASSSITVKATGKITKIVFDCNNSTYATDLKNSIGTVSGVTVTVSSDKVTVTFTNAVESFVIATLSAQVRLDSLTVTYQG